MYSKHSWFIEKLVVHGKFDATLESEDLKDMVAALQNDTCKRTFRLHYLADMQYIERVAASVSQFRAAMTALDKLPIDWVVFINPHKATTRHLVNMFAATSFQFLRVKFQCVDSFEQAVSFLARQDDFVADEIHATK